MGEKVLLGGAGRWKYTITWLRCLGVQQVFSGRVNTSEPVEPLKINGLWGWTRRC